MHEVCGHNFWLVLQRRCDYVSLNGVWYVAYIKMIIGICGSQLDYVWFPTMEHVT